MEYDFLNPTRRRFFQIGSVSVVISSLPFPVLAQLEETSVSLDRYKPEFLNEEEWAFILAATARLIPSEGEGPGALEAHVPIYIDKALSGPWGQAADWYVAGPHDRNADPTLGYQAEATPAQAYRASIPEINRWCRERFGEIFAKITPQQQDEALTFLQKGEIPLSALQTAQFFAFLLQNTKEGYFADPQYGGNYRMAPWVYIGFPGARASFREWVERDNIPYRLGPVSLSGERAES